METGPQMLVHTRNRSDTMGAVHIHPHLHPPTHSFNHLEDQRIARHERGDQRVEDVVQGVVPGHNRANHAEGHELHMHL